jgi:hypothetical protein
MSGQASPLFCDERVIQLGNYVHERPATCKLKYVSELPETRTSRPRVLLDDQLFHTLNVSGQSACKYVCS